jgi:hypothetical protein
MKASEFIKSLKELIKCYNEHNGVVISDIDIKPEIIFQGAEYHVIDYEVKFTNLKP